MSRFILIGAASLHLISFLFVTLYDGAYSIEPVDSFWRNYTGGLIRSFHRQAGTFPQQIQFAGLFFYSGAPTNNWDTYSSFDANRNMIPGTSFDNSQQGYPNPERAINYRIASADRTGFHSEEVILQTGSLQTMYNNYLSVFRGPPQSVVIFSWLIPCGERGRGHNCRQRIVNTFSEEPVSRIPNRYVVYNREARDIECASFFDLLDLNHISLIGPVDYLHPLFTTTTTTDSYRQKRQLSSQSFHECLKICYGWELGACAVDKGRAGKLFTYQLMFQIKSDFPNVVGMQSKAIRWIRENVAMNCKAHINLEKRTNYCIKYCTESCSPGSVETEMECLVDPGMSGWLSICSAPWKVSTEGVLCSKFKRDSVTVGGCPGVSMCGRLDRYSFSWARKTRKCNWDYCCEGECYDGRCQVGDNKWRNCGSPGFLTVNGEPCRDDHPCGLHGQDYYWCYTESSWDFCCNKIRGQCAKNSMNKDTCDVGSRASVHCQRCGGKLTTTIDGKQCRDDHPCSTHEENYYWCYLADGSWNYCCNPYTQCSYERWYRGGNWCPTGIHSNDEKTWQYCKVV